MELEMFDKDKDLDTFPNLLQCSGRFNPWNALASCDKPEIDWKTKTDSSMSHSSPRCFRTSDFVSDPGFLQTHFPTRTLTNF
jgi:hypothetical protein